MYSPLVYYIFGTLMLVLSIIPVFIYLKFGREPKIDYNASYEREIPFDDPPAVVNAICNKLSEKVGEPDINGYMATIIDLIDRKYLVMVDSPNNGKAEPKSLLVSINYDKDFDELYDFEMEIINFLRSYPGFSANIFMKLNLHIIKYERDRFNSGFVYS